MIGVFPDGSMVLCTATEDVRIPIITSPMLGALEAMVTVCRYHGVDCVMTGAGAEAVYHDEPAHLRGFAWDFRCRNFKDSTRAFTMLKMVLARIDPRYRAVHILPPKAEHFHIEWNGPWT